MLSKHTIKLIRKQNKKYRQKNTQKNRQYKYNRNYPAYKKENKIKSKEQKDVDFTTLIPELLRIVYEYAKQDCSEMPTLEYNFESIRNVYQTVSHDGYDRYGPESVIYNMYILLKHGNYKYVAIWHREIWYHGMDSDQYYYFRINKEFNKYMSEIKDNYSLRDVYDRFRRFLHKRKRLK